MSTNETEGKSWYFSLSIGTGALFLVVWSAAFLYMVAKFGAVTQQSNDLQKQIPMLESRIAELQRTTDTVGVWKLKVDAISDWTQNRIQKKADSSGLVSVAASTPWGRHGRLGRVEGSVNGKHFASITIDDRGSVNVSGGSFLMPVEAGDKWEVKNFDNSPAYNVTTENIHVRWVRGYVK
ncbi:hypothetical protein OAH18_02575 [bacterium]|nr:hypothetical protein [bacterium]